MRALKAVAAPPALGPALLPLLRELGELKRIRSAGRSGSIAERLFLTAWGALVAGAPLADVMTATCGRALAAARLGDLDEETLTKLGLGEDERRAILRSAVEAVGEDADAGLIDLLARAAWLRLPIGEPPAFAALLVEQPRAGVTCPGRPRLMLQPAENHAEHCLIVAVYGVLAAPAFGAAPEAVFMAGLAHHLHSAAMPDSGYTGEMLLGNALDRVIENARKAALAELSPPLAAQARAAIAPIADDATAEARAFHAADGIDRVLEIEQHLRAASATMATVLGDYALVHDGPVKPFQDRVLAEIGLL